MDRQCVLQLATSATLGSTARVQSNRFRTRINQQGILQQSNSGNDIAMSGNGFFVVKADVTGLRRTALYARAGSFSEDARASCATPQVSICIGWPLDQNGQIPAGAADTSSLVPVDGTAFLGGFDTADNRRIAGAQP